MKSSLQITRVPIQSPEWFEFRKSGIGGSEIATVLGLNPYDTVTRTFYEKLGMVEPRKIDNSKMFFGRYMEDKIAELWEFYDGQTDGWIENYKNNKIIRKCRSINGYVVNPDYPWLFASLDRVQNVTGGINLLTGKELKTEAVLEVKTLSYWSANMWVDQIPISYLLQIHQYMIIIEADYAEIAILKDGNEFIVEKVQRDEALCQRIINISKGFWYNRVLPAKEAYRKKVEAEKSDNLREIEKYDAIIQQLEPEPDGSNAYEDFMNERYLKEKEEIEGNMEDYNLCLKDKSILALSNKLDDERQLIKNTLIKKLTLESAEIINFGKLGQCSFSERKGSKNRVFSNKIKEKPDEEWIEKEFKKIDFGNEND